MANLLTEEQFSKAYEELADPIFRHCYFRVYDREKAKELMQETFLKTWQYLSEGKEIQNLRTFLYKVANNLVIDYARKKKESSLDAMQESGFEAKEDHRERLIDQLDGARLIKMLDGLDESYRQVVLLKYVDQLTPKEIAQTLGETENAVYVRLHRAIKQLKEIYHYD